MNPERSAISRVDGESRVQKIERAASRILHIYPRAEAQLKEKAIDITTFTDLYGAENIQKDTDEVTRLKREFAKSDGAQVGRLRQEDISHLAQILEYYIYKGVNEGNWIPQCTAIKTSEYDDIKNGIDLVLEHSNEHSHTHLGLAVDVTFAEDVSRKLQRIKQSIDSDELSRVKYFSSEKSHMRGELRNIPRVVSAIDLEIFEDLFTSEARGNFKEHQARAALMQDMETQLATFSTYAHRTNRRCAERLDQTHRFVQTINDPIRKRSDPEYLRKHMKAQRRLTEALEIFR